MQKRYEILEMLLQRLHTRDPRPLRCTAHVHAQVKRALATLRKDDGTYFEVVLVSNDLPPREVTYAGPRGGAIDREIFLRFKKVGEGSKSPEFDGCVHDVPLPQKMDMTGIVTPEMDAHFRAKHGLPAEGFVPVDMERVRRRVEEMRATGAGAGLQNTFAEGQTQQDSLQDSEERPPEHDPWTGFFDKFRDSDSAQDSETGLQNPKPDGDA